MSQNMITGNETNFVGALSLIMDVLEESAVQHMLKN